MIIIEDDCAAYMEYARAISNGELPNGRALLGHMSSERVHARFEDGKNSDGFANDVFTYIQSLASASSTGFETRRIETPNRLPDDASG